MAVKSLPSALRHPHTIRRTAHWDRLALKCIPAHGESLLLGPFPRRRARGSRGRAREPDVAGGKWLVEWITKSVATGHPGATKCRGKAPAPNEWPGWAEVGVPPSGGSRGEVAPLRWATVMPLWVVKDGGGDEREEFSGGVALEAADRFASGFAFAETPGEVGA